MITVLVHRDGVTQQAPKVEPAWLAADAPERVWVDISRPEDADRLLLESVFHFHELAIEDALADIHHPKIETYDNLLYLILHGIAASEGTNDFVTQDVDFFLGRNFLVTVHSGPSRSIETELAVCHRHPDILAEGPASLLHRIVDRIVDHYVPEVEKLENDLANIEQVVFEEANVNPMRALLELKTNIAALRRVTVPQRDAIGRLARREFPQISEALTYRFRDVYDHLVRITEESVFMQDRVTSLLDAHLSNQSNRLNRVMKVLTVIATIFMPLTVLTGLYGMNVDLPLFPGSPAAQFWWICTGMLALSGSMLWIFRRQGWL